jgi:hypothetical protein
MNYFTSEPPQPGTKCEEFHKKKHYMKKATPRKKSEPKTIIIIDEDPDVLDLDFIDKLIEDDEKK